MTAPWSITITPVPKSEECRIHTSDGQDFTVKGLALFADGGEGHLFQFTWNSPHVAASGCVRACCEAIRRGDRFVVAFYHAMLGMFAQATSIPPASVNAEDILRRWEAQEKYDAVKKPDREFN